MNHGKSRIARVSADGSSISFYLKVGSLRLLPADNRADRLIEKGGVTQPHVLHAWEQVIALMQPAVVLDVGANHGEMIFPLLFRPDAAVVMFEPNVRLAELLKQSAREHINCSQIRVEALAVSDTTGQGTLFLDMKWSGTSSLDYKMPDARYKGEGEQHYKLQQIEKVSVDDYLARIGAPPGPLAMKIDVEGHEPHVVAGAHGALASRPFTLLVEFDPNQLQLAGLQPEAFLEQLLETGDVFLIRQDGKFSPVSHGKDLDIRHGDLLVTSSEAVSRFATNAGVGE